MMRGEFIGVWSEIWHDIWGPLINREGVPEDIFCELYRELCNALRERPRIELLADIIDDPVQASDAFRAVTVGELLGERSLVGFLEEAHAIIDDLGGAELSFEYFRLLSSFVEKYSIRYDLRAPCRLCPSLSGVFASMMRDLRAVAKQDDHLGGLYSDFEESVWDLRGDMSDRKIKTVIQKQVNVLEALGALCPGVKAGELGRMCSEIGSWPHGAVQAALRNIYGFASDYPGIRHGGNPAGAIRQIDMRDMIAMSIVLVGFTPYLRDAFDPDSIFMGS